MFAIVQRPPEKAIVYLDRPQRLGILPTLAFWHRSDVWKSARYVMAPFAGLWVMLLGLFMPAHISVWLDMAIATMGYYLFLGAFERVIRRRLRQRAASAALPRDRLPGDRNGDS